MLPIASKSYISITVCNSNRFKKSTYAPLQFSQNQLSNFNGSIRGPQKQQSQNRCSSLNCCRRRTVCSTTGYSVNNSDGAKQQKPRPPNSQVDRNNFSRFPPLVWNDYVFTLLIYPYQANQRVSETLSDQYFSNVCSLELIYTLGIWWGYDKNHQIACHFNYEVVSRVIYAEKAWKSVLELSGILREKFLRFRG